MTLVDRIAQGLTTEKDANLVERIIQYADAVLMFNNKLGRDLLRLALNEADTDTDECAG